MQWIEELANDLGYAVRLLRRSPGFTTMAVASLALGIGANTAIFTLLNAVMVRPLPVRSPDELVTVGDPSRPTALREGGPMLDILSYPLYRRLRDQNRVFTGLLAAGRSGRIEMTAPTAARWRSFGAGSSLATTSRCLACRPDWAAPSRATTSGSREGVPPSSSATTSGSAVLVATSGSWATASG